MEKFKQCCVRMANMFGHPVETYLDIPDELRIYFEAIGHVRVCAIFVMSDLKEGKSERRVARIYGITRRQVQTIRGWNRRGQINKAPNLER